MSESNEEGVVDYVLGYGSLIQTESRRRNLGDEGAPLPVRLHGWRRGWNLRGPGVGFVGTFLGATEEPGATINGVLVPVAAEEWLDLDRRETGYRRVRVDPSKLEALDDVAEPLSSDAAIYLYVTEDVAPPHGEAPILQSYVDICLGGCSEIDTHLGSAGGFTDEFLTTTAGWSEHWVNDRLYPRAPFRANPDALRIDRVLEQRLPREFAAIRIE